MGEIDYEPTSISQLQIIASQSFWQFYGENRIMPENCGYVNQLAIFEDILNLGTKVKGFYKEKAESLAKQMKKVKQSAQPF